MFDEAKKYFRNIEKIFQTYDVMWGEVRHWSEIVKASIIVSSEKGNYFERITISYAKNTIFFHMKEFNKGLLSNRMLACIQKLIQDKKTIVCFTSDDENVVYEMYGKIGERNLELLRYLIPYMKFDYSKLVIDLEGIEFQLEKEGNQLYITDFMDKLGVITKEGIDSFVERTKFKIEETNKEKERIKKEIAEKWERIGIDKSFLDYLEFKTSVGLNESNVHLSFPSVFGITVQVGRDKGKEEAIDEFLKAMCKAEKVLSIAKQHDPSSFLYNGEKWEIECLFLFQTKYSFVLLPEDESNRVYLGGEIELDNESDWETKWHKILQQKRMQSLFKGKDELEFLEKEGGLPSTQESFYEWIRKEYENKIAILDDSDVRTFQKTVKEA